MPYCLLLNNVYRIGDVFFDLGAVPRFEIRFCIRAPDFTVICQNWGDHRVENLIRKLWRQFAEICVFSKTEKGVKSLLFQFIKCQ